MEESKLIPEDNNSTESSTEVNKENIKEENVKAFTEFLEKASEKEDLDQKIKTESLEKQSETYEGSIFQRFLNNGFDAISTNPNHKMLALLIILLINLSLFFVIGNIGKAFLRNAGILA